MAPNPVRWAAHLWSFQSRGFNQTGLTTTPYRHNRNTQHFSHFLAGVPAVQIKPFHSYTLVNSAFKMAQSLQAELWPLWPKSWPKKNTQSGLNLWCFYAFVAEKKHFRPQWPQSSATMATIIGHNGHNENSE